MAPPLHKEGGSGTALLLELFFFFPRNPGVHEYANFAATALPQYASTNHDRAHLAHNTEGAVCSPCAVVSMSRRSVKHM